MLFYCIFLLFYLYIFVFLFYNFRLSELCFTNVGVGTLKGSSGELGGTELGRPPLGPCPINDKSKNTSKQSLAGKTWGAWPPKADKRMRPENLPKANDYRTWAFKSSDVVLRRIFHRELDSDIASCQENEKGIWRERKGERERERHNQFNCHSLFFSREWKRYTKRGRERERERERELTKHNSCSLPVDLYLVHVLDRTIIQIVYLFSLSLITYLSHFLAWPPKANKRKRPDKLPKAHNYRAWSLKSSDVVLVCIFPLRLRIWHREVQRRWTNIWREREGESEREGERERERKRGRHNEI